MAVPDPNTAFATTLVAALHALGLTDVCLSPGSRNTPLTLAFASHPDITDWVHHDERSAGFFALGLARAAERPVALVATSGTAAVEYHPAVVEARQSRVPLLVLTADRPPELRDVGAPQAIDQVKLYGDAVKWYHGAAPPDLAALPTVPSLAAHAWGEAVDSPAGPVHLNLPFREPLTPPETTVPPPAMPPPPAVAVGLRTPASAAVAELGALLEGRRTLFVVGALPRRSDAAAVDRLADACGAVVMADPQSGLRLGPAEATVIGMADLLAATGALDADLPEVVVRWGALPTSKPVWRWLEDHPEIPQILVDPGAHRDPLASARHVVRCDVAATAEALAGLSPSDPAWPTRWRDRDTAAAAAVAAHLAGEPFPNEPAIAATVAAHAPAGTAIFAGSSMPIRDLDGFGGKRESAVPVLANRGANGIDGSLSTALGIAAHRACIALVGDVAALHDVGALATAARLGLPVTFVVVHNDGGGIFELLPQAEPGRLDRATFDRVFGTPHGTDFVAVARSVGMAASRVEDRGALIDALTAAPDTPRLIELRTERRDIRPLRSRLLATVAAC